MGGGKTFEIGFSLLSEADKSLDLLCAPQPSFLPECCFLVCGQFNEFFALVRSGVRTDDLSPEIDGEGAVVRLDNDLFTDGPWGHGKGVCIEAAGEVGVNLCGGRIPVIREELGQWS